MNRNSNFSRHLKSLRRFSAAILIAFSSQITSLAQDALVQPIAAVSRQTHGTAGVFDLPLQLTGLPSIECRTGTPAQSYQIVFLFSRPVSFSGAAVTTAGSGTVSSASINPNDARQAIVNLTGISNSQTITVILRSVNDGFYVDDVSIRMSVLVGDVTANGAVTSSDSSAVNANSGRSAASAIFRTDVNADGAINSSDLALVNSAAGRALPYRTFGFSLDASYKTSAGVYATDGTLIRTLWRNETQGPGFTARLWDGNDDNGAAAPAGSYQIKLIYHNVQYVWDGVIGNTSTAMSGHTLHAASTFMQSLALDGTTAFYAVGENEGFAQVHRFSTNSPQQQTNVVPADFLVGFDLVATDGNRFYYANSGSKGEKGNCNNVNGCGDPCHPTFVAARNVADNSEALFAAGRTVRVECNTPSTYSSCIDVDFNAATNPAVNPRRPTGLAVQKSGNILAVAHGGLNVVRLFNKTTGAPLAQNISVPNPHGVAFAPNNDLWVITGTTVRRYTNVATAPTRAATITALAAPLTVSVHPSNNDMVLVADGASSQQVKAFTSSGIALWAYPVVPGGYSTRGPDVTDDKFKFAIGDSTNLLARAPLAVQADGSFWIGDGATNRLLHINALRTGAIAADTIMFLPHNGSTSVDPVNPSRVIGDNWLEFEVDYTKPIQSSWTLKKNWAAGDITGALPASYFGPGTGLNSEGIQSVTTLNGRRYGTVVNDFTTNRKVVVELPPLNTKLRACKFGSADLTIDSIPGAPAFYGATNPIVPSFQADGSLFYNQISPGPTASWYQRSVASFDAQGNFQWTAPTLLASAPYTHDDPVAIGSDAVWLTSSTPNVLVSFDDRARKAPVPTGQPRVLPVCDGWHLGAVPLNGSDWRWKSSPANTLPYFDGLGSFYIGPVQYAGSRLMGFGRSVIYGYNGEGWNNSEASQWMHFYDNGLFVGQFGTPGNYQNSLRGALPGFTGNAFFPSLVDVEGEAFLWANDQSQHSAVSRWHIVGLNTIREQTGTIASPGHTTLADTAPQTFPSGLRATPADRQVALTWNPVPGATSYIVKSAEIAGGPFTPALISTTPAGTVTLHNGSPLQNGKPYYFTVSADTSSINSTQVQAWPFALVGLAGSLRGGPPYRSDPPPFHASSYPYRINPSAVAQGAPSLKGLNEVLGNLSRCAIGTKGYVIYGTPAGSETTTVQAPFAVTRSANWVKEANFVHNRFFIGGNLGQPGGLVASPSGSITISGGDANVHYLTVFCPSVVNEPRNLTLTLRPFGQGTPSAHYAATEPRGSTDLLVYQFQFTGNVTLTMDSAQGSTSCIQAVFID